MAEVLESIADIIADSLNVLKPGPLARLLDKMPRHCFNHTDYREAAVYIILDDKADMLVIQKPSYNDGYPWAGQIAFPGGLKETSDRDFLDTALREVFEEVGVAAGQLHTVGSLGRFPTISRVSIEAFIGFALEPLEPRPQQNEVERIIWADTALLLRTHLEKGYVYPEIEVRELLYPLGNVTIWGATARIIQFLLNAVIANRNLCT